MVAFFFRPTTNVATLIAKQHQKIIHSQTLNANSDSHRAMSHTGHNSDMYDPMKTTQLHGEYIHHHEIKKEKKNATAASIVARTDKQDMQ